MADTMTDSLVTDQRDPETTLLTLSSLPLHHWGSEDLVYSLIFAVVTQIQNVVQLSDSSKLVVLCLEPQIGWFAGGEIFSWILSGEQMPKLSMYPLVVNGVFHAVNHCFLLHSD